MRAARSPYSSRSWPSSDVGNFWLAIRSSVSTATGDGIDVLLTDESSERHLLARPGARAPGLQVRPGDGDYAAPPSAAATFSKIVFTLPPAAVTAATATSAMSATSNAYSSRSWPSSLRANDFTKFTSCMTSPFGCVHRTQCGALCGGAAVDFESAARHAGWSWRRLRRRSERGGDVREDRLHAATGRGDGRDRDERDERHEQCVLEQ